MAVKIPVYERTQNLDAAAQTIPRYKAADAAGRGLEKLGGAITAVGEHWQKRQEQFENFQFAERQKQTQAQANAIIQEEGENYDPGRDPPGSLHDRIMKRLKPLQDAFIAQTPSRLRPMAVERMSTFEEQHSTTVARAESGIGRAYYTKILDSTAGALAAGVKANPDSFDAAMKQLKQTVDGAVNIPKAQRETMFNAYARTMAKNAVAGYGEQKRYDEGRAFIDRTRKQFDVAPPVPGIGPRSDAGDGAGLNARRVAQIDAIPEAKAAIERAAAKYGVDPDLAKVTASIESSGKYGPESDTGKYKGLFQLSAAEFGLGGGTNIYDVNQNADRGVAILARDIRNFRNANGRDPTATEVYMGHQQGPAGTNAHLSNPNGTAWQNVRKFYGSDAIAKQAIWGNIPDDLKRKFGTVENVKSKDIIAIYDSKVRGTSLEAGYANADKIAAMPRGRRAPVEEAGSQPIRADAQGRIIGGVQVASTDPSVGIPKAQEPFKLTQLSPEDEQKFLSDLKASPFYKEFVQKHGEQPNINDKQYDYRGLWKSGGAAAFEGTRNEKDGLLHLPSKTPDGQWLKSPDHPTHWKEIFMERAGHDPDTADIQTIEQANEYLKQEGKPPIEDVTPSTSPQQTQSEQPTQVAAAAPVTEWGSWADSMHATLDAAENKAAQKDTVMKTRLTNYINNDLASIQATGKSVKLDGELANYFGTTDIGPELVEKVLGPQKAAEWEDNRQTAMRIFGAVENLKVLPYDQMLQAVESIRPTGGEVDFIRRDKVYQGTLKAAQSIVNARNADPAAAADQMPEVKAALDKLKAIPQFNGDPAKGGTINPQWKEASGELARLRMQAQEYLGVAQPSPLTKAEAAQFAARLTDPSNDPASSVKITQAVVGAVVDAVGGDQEMAKRALSSVLRMKGIKDQQAQDAAVALAQIGKPETFTTKDGTKLQPGKGVTPVYEYNPEPFAIPGIQPSVRYPVNDDGAFVPGSPNNTLMDPADVKALRSGGMTNDDFNARYGVGSSDWVMQQAAKFPGPTGPGIGGDVLRDQGEPSSPILPPPDEEDTSGDLFGTPPVQGFE